MSFWQNFYWFNQTFAAIDQKQSAGFSGLWINIEADVSMITKSEGSILFVTLSYIYCDFLHVWEFV